MFSRQSIVENTPQFTSVDGRPADSLPCALTNQRRALLTNQRRARRDLQPPVLREPGRAAARRWSQTGGSSGAGTGRSADYGTKLVSQQAGISGSKCYD